MQPYTRFLKLFQTEGKVTSYKKYVSFYVISWTATNRFVELRMMLNEFE